MAKLTIKEKNTVYDVANAMYYAMSLLESGIDSVAKEGVVSLDDAHTVFHEVWEKLEEHKNDAVMGRNTPAVKEIYGRILARGKADTKFVQAYPLNGGK